MCVVVTVVYIVLHSHSQSNWELNENYRYPASYHIEELNATLAALKVVIKNAPDIRSQVDKLDTHAVVNLSPKLRGGDQGVDNVGTLQNAVNSWSGPLEKHTEVSVANNNAVKKRAVVFTMDSISACKHIIEPRFTISP